MFWTEEKLEARVKELASWRYREAQRIEVFRALVDEEGEVGVRPPEGGQWRDMKQGDRWEGRDLYLWLDANVSIPAEWTNRRVVGLFDFGLTGAGNNSGFESLLYLNGVPYQGVDSNHKEVFLPEGAAGTTVRVQFRLWSGLEGGGEPQQQEHRLHRAEIVWLDEATDRFYYMSKAVLQTIKVLSSGIAERTDLLTALDRSFLSIDWSRPGSERFYESISAAEDELRQAIEAIPRNNSSVTVRCIGHTHIDVAWLWRLKHTREKSARSFSTVLRLMELFPEYVFLQTQPQLYEYLKNDYPDIYAALKERVKEGRWEAAGGMWLEADCNLTSGESIVRQLLYGTKFLREEFGTECTYLWLPDVFGYSWALPQILRKSGISTFMTTKISWNQYNRMPHDTFQWRGIDGSKVLTHFITTPEDSDNWWYTYNGDITASSVQGIWDKYRDKEVNRELLLSYGYGDGGGGVNREHLEMRRQLANMPGLPKVETGRADEYFAKLQQTVEQSDRYVHTWDGELYLEYHRGTYTSQAYNKRMNRKLELLSRDAEWLQVCRAALSGDWSNYPQEQLDESWKIILRNQFHDIIPGSSIPEVYHDSREEYEQAKDTLEDCRVQAITALSDKGTVGDDEYVIWNASSWSYNGLVAVENCAKDTAWRDAEGRLLVSEFDGERHWVKVQDVPALGFVTLRREDSLEAETKGVSPFSIRDRAIDTPFYELEWNEKGQLTRLYDRAAGREVLAPGNRANVLQVFEDKPKMFEAWDIDIYYGEKMQEIDGLVSSQVEVGLLRTVVTFVWSYMDSSIRQRMIVYADNRRIDFETEVDWQERQQLLKVAFPVDIRTTEATYDIQFGNVKRPTHWNTSWDYARFETVGHQWVDLSEHGYGVSLLNDCKYGHDIKDGVIRLTLIKSATYPDPGADQGEHLFTYALYPHEGDWREGHTAQAAWQLNQPVYATAGRAPTPKFSLLRLVQGDAMIDAVKRAEDGMGLIVRLHEYKGGRSQIALASDVPIQSWQETDLLERPLETAAQSGPIILDLSPYEIKTIRISLR
ncbi:alpha-mannosidase [Cohnella abietis]|uniref:Alpha-mannosidase n=1 Tax=Cohnella abietis TaxID=2507935 RepID=A0A3T1D1J3_9BACL|nr:alpha-mannosidase [Cohnella abietis]BBI31921.1 alpha-mannosidase [Cohnella abietis]